MDPTYELTADARGRYSFTLKDGSGTPLLLGPESEGRIATGVDVVHVRRAVQDIHRFVPHLASDGAFVELQDERGAVLAKSPHVPKEQLRVLVDRIREVAPIAWIREADTLTVGVF